MLYRLKVIFHELNDAIYKNSSAYTHVGHENRCSYRILESIENKKQRMFIAIKRKKKA
ncbi:hypothetical protein METP1_00234 [Methanosarcinales archaeon]|nr:hypothetical protein METP1_00234 [Methanosarcinales archaeon]